MGSSFHPMRFGIAQLLTGEMMNEELSKAQQAMKEIGIILDKYNCEMIYEEMRRNGEVAFSRIAIIEKQQPSLVVPANGNGKVLRAR